MLVIIIHPNGRLLFWEWKCPRWKGGLKEGRGVALFCEWGLSLCQFLLLPQLIQATLTAGVPSQSNCVSLFNPIAEKGAFTPSCVYCIFGGNSPILSSSLWNWRTSPLPRLVTHMSSTTIILSSIHNCWPIILFFFRKNMKSKVTHLNLGFMN